MREDVESFRARVQTQSFELDRMQQYYRKDNIRVYGIDETADECTNTIIVKAKIYEISSDTHQLHYIPKHHFII